MMSLVMGLFIASCEDDNDYTISTTPVLDASSVVTGSSDVTATTATLHATVSGLENMSSKAYTVGFYYGLTQDKLSEQVSGSYSEGAVSADISGLTNNTTLYYQAFVCLQSKLYYTGEVKSLVTTNAKVTTKAAESVDYASAVLGATAVDYPDDATCGIVISTTAGEEAVRAGLIVQADALSGSFSIDREGLLPNTTYYYAAYLNLGTGIVYGDVESFTTDAYEFDLDNDLVDLGLSVKWARFNVGAKEATDLGGLFAFGDLSGCNNSIDVADYPATGDTYRTAADLVFNVYQGKATLPTAADFEELFSLCKKEWVEQDGVTGYKLTGPNGNTLFLPAAGTRIGNDVTGVGTDGYYQTGTINPSNPQFAVSYQFTSGVGVKTTTAVYQGVAVRGVSTAKNVRFDRELLYGKWYLDNGQDGKQHVFEGPFTQWGDTDTWATVSNGQPNIEQQIHWEMGTNNGWIGYTYGVDYGYMEFLENGMVNIHRLADDGTPTDETGTYTIDEVNKVIDIDINVLCANTWVAVKSGKLNILSLTSDGLQIAIRNNDGYAYSLNYYSERKAIADAKIPVSLICVDGDWAGTWGTIVDEIAPEDLDGQHSFVYEASAGSARVFTLDFQTMMSKYPNALIRIDEIKCDDNPIVFDANKFRYGDIENNGNYRIEMFNCYGKAAAGGKVIDSPFSNSQDIEFDPAFRFTSKLEIVYTIFKEFNGTFTPNLITINPSWGGTWGHNQGATLNVKLEDNQYVIENPSFDIKYESTEHAAGSIMTFIEVVDFYGYFPGTHATLDNLYLDGTEVSFDTSKVIDSNEAPKYRLELWNMYGATNTAGCAFGIPVQEGDNKVIKELGFSSSMEVKFTFHNLFTVPTW